MLFLSTWHWRTTSKAILWARCWTKVRKVDTEVVLDSSLRRYWRIKDIHCFIAWFLTSYQFQSQAFRRSFQRGISLLYSLGPSWYLCRIQGIMLSIRHIHKAKEIVINARWWCALPISIDIPYSGWAPLCNAVLSFLNKLICLCLHVRLNNWRHTLRFLGRELPSSLFSSRRSSSSTFSACLWLRLYSLRFLIYSIRQVKWITGDFTAYIVNLQGN